ncbi:hypothetical protein BX667DRAFT_493669 [Coemansia mojavensis]|nr:hypothetical protein BX667DRAFT_493669 [Coemansia mojavensis]
MASNKVEMDKSVGAGDGAKRKHSMVSAAASEIDLSLLDPPRPGRPCREASQDPAMQEARKRARVLRNRAAAQLSREKKRQHLEQLEQENAELRSKNKELEERLSRAEDANAGLSAKLDGLAQQLQSFQALVLQSQKQSLTPPALDWNSMTPLVASPMPSCTNASAEASLPFTPSPSQVASATNTMFSADTTLASSAPAVTVTSAVPTNAELVMEATPKASAAAELSSKGLSESAADVLAIYGEYLSQAGTSGSSFGDAGGVLLDQFMQELGAADGQHGGSSDGVSVGGEQSTDSMDDFLHLVVGAQPKWRLDQQAPAFAHGAWDLGA